MGWENVSYIPEGTAVPECVVCPGRRRRLEEAIDSDELLALTALPRSPQSERPCQGRSGRVWEMMANLEIYRMRTWAWQVLFCSALPTRSPYLVLRYLPYHTYRQVPTQHKTYLCSGNPEPLDRRSTWMLPCPGSGDPLVSKTSGGDSVWSHIASFIDTDSVRASGFGSGKVILQYSLPIASFIDTDSAQQIDWLTTVSLQIRICTVSILPLPSILIPYGTWIG